MNIQKIFEVLEEDQDNSALGIICSEFEQQGYSVNVNSLSISSDDIFEGGYDELEKLSEVEIELLKNDVTEQKFIIEFVDFHNVIIKSH